MLIDEPNPTAEPADPEDDAVFSFTLEMAAAH
jgi:hypothetical protein